MLLRHLRSLCRQEGRGRRPCRPRLEQLEQRLQPASLLWVAPDGMDLQFYMPSRAANWVNFATGPPRHPPRATR